ncbi:MAG: hypothetical protein IPK07_22475 [Deltaproteobacteria bacterium]|nr:hypothetical protein [Deltaproteobacteria bacterium]
MSHCPSPVATVWRLGAAAFLGCALVSSTVAEVRAEGVFRWRDDAGVVHVAARLDEVPARYRAEAAVSRHDEEARAAARDALEAADARTEPTPPADAQPSASDRSGAWAALAGFAAPRSPAGPTSPEDGCARAREMVARWQLGPEWGGGTDRSALEEATRLCPEDQRIRVLATMSSPEPRELEPPKPKSKPKPVEPEPPPTSRSAALAKPRPKAVQAPDLPGVGEGFASSQTAHFDFRWAEETRENRSHGDNQEAVEEYLEDAYREVGQWLGAYPSRRIPVVFYARGDFKNRFPGASWAWGFWDGSAIRINSTLKSAQVIRDELYHEYAHVLVSELTGRSRPPAWLNEGLAELVEHRAQFGLARALDPPSTLVRNVAAQTKAGLHGPLSGPFFAGGGCGTRRRAYARAYLAVVYLQDEKGMDGVLRIFRELGRGKSFGDAMGLVYPRKCRASRRTSDGWLQDEAR